MEEEIEKRLNGCIRYWKNKLEEMRAFLSPTEAGLIQTTVKLLESYKEENHGK